MAEGDSERESEVHFVSIIMAPRSSFSPFHCLLMFANNLHGSLDKKTLEASKTKRHERANGHHNEKEKSKQANKPTNKRCCFLLDCLCLLAHKQLYIRELHHQQRVAGIIVKISKILFSVLWGQIDIINLDSITK